MIPIFLQMLYSEYRVQPDLQIRSSVN